MYTTMTLIKLCDKWHSNQVELQDMPRYLSANLILNFGGHVLKSLYIIRSLTLHISPHIHYYIYGSHLYIHHSSPTRGEAVVERGVPISFWLLQILLSILTKYAWKSHSLRSYKNIVLSNKLYKQPYIYITIPTHIYTYNTTTQY